MGFLLQISTDYYFVKYFQLPITFLAITNFKIVGTELLLILLNNVDAN